MSYVGKIISDIIFAFANLWKTKTNKPSRIISKHL